MLYRKQSLFFGNVTKGLFLSVATSYTISFMLSDRSLQINFSLQ